MTSTQLTELPRREGACPARSLSRVAACAFVLGALAAAFTGCATSAPSHDEVFYLHASAPVGKNATWETYVTAMDGAATERLPASVGVAVLGGDVKLSRPRDWYVREADYTEHRRYISYQSPRRFIFSIYERIDSSGDSWADLTHRFEADLKQEGSEILGAAMPVAVANGQGRSYLLKTPVPGKPPYDAFAHETLVRGDHRVLLVQVVHPEDTDAIAEEASTVMRSLLVY